MNGTADWSQPALDHDFVTEKAPRTALGWRRGSLALLEVDGVEDLNLGPDLFEFAELAVRVCVCVCFSVSLCVCIPPYLFAFRFHIQ